MTISPPLVAFIIPCYNEESSIASVIHSAKSLIPSAQVYVCDNGSTDNTRAAALEAGATVYFEPKKGKGNAVKRLLRDVEADVFVMVDGDDTYDMQYVPQAIQQVIAQGYDLLTGDRMAFGHSSSFRKGHQLGNKLFTRFFRVIFDIKTRDVFSGLRVFSRRLVKSFPIVSSEFEIETELTIYAARMGLPVADFPSSVKERYQSESKLKTYEDGSKILWFAVRLLHREYPLRLYAALSAIILLLGSITVTDIYFEFLQTGVVLRQPTLIMALFLISASILLLIGGMTLKEISNLKYEGRYLAYLNRKARTSSL
jgi:glycosyltransferase involved in cell wall biosynthesis